MFEPQAIEILVKGMMVNLLIKEGLLIVTGKSEIALVHSPR